MLFYFIGKMNIIEIPDWIWVILIIVLIFAVLIPIINRRKILKEGGQEAEQIKEEIEEVKKKSEKGLWLKFTLMSIGGLISASFIIIQLNLMFSNMNEFSKTTGGETFLNTINQTELIQKIIGIDIGISLIIIAGFWLCYIFVENKKPKDDHNFDPFEETKKNKKIPISILLIGLIITFISFVFL